MNRPSARPRTERRRAGGAFGAENPQVPRLEGESAAELSADRGPALSVAVVARRLGVAPATLRTWARRYGVGPSEHAAGAHRRYAPSDVARLEVMRRLTR